MKKRIVALLLGGVLAAGSLAMQTPVTAWAANMSECSSPDHYAESSSHINSSAVKAIDGKLAVTIDLEFEHADAYFELYVYDKQLEKTDRGDFEFYPVTDETPLNEVKSLKQSDTYTFEEFADNKNYYVYCVVYDNHGDGESDTEDEKVMYLHYAAYLGSVTPVSSADSDSDNSSSSDSSSSDSDSDDSDSDDSTPATPPRDYAREAEERVLNQIQSAPAGSTVVMDRSITTLSNAAMKELLKQGDVSLKLDFTYLGQRYVITIPAGKALNDDVPWYGPLYLAQQFGNSASVNEVNAKDTEQELIAQIKETPADHTIVMDKGVTTLSNAVIKELQKKGDVSLRLEFTYENKEYVITIPAGAVIDDDIPWYGPLYLIDHFGNGAQNAN